MKIQFRQTGGFAGLVKSADIQSDQLSPQDAQSLQTLVDQADFFTLSAPSRARGADEEQYLIVVEDEGRSRQLHLSRSSVPESLRPLVNYLLQHAQYEKR